MLKNILIAVGVIAIIVFISFLVIGVKVISSVLVYVVGFIAVIALIGFIIYYIGKFSGRKSRE